MMTQQTMAGRAIPGRASAPGGAAEVAVRRVGALLALAVAAVHVADQGGITQDREPPAEPASAEFLRQRRGRAVHLTWPRGSSCPA